MGIKYNRKIYMENAKQWFLQTIVSLQPTLSEKILQKGLSKLKQHKLLPLNPNLSSQSSNQIDMKILSPFYDRNRVCKKSNCFCPYHRKMRYQLIKKHKYQPKKGTQTMQQSPRKAARSPSQKPQRYSYRTSFHSPAEKENVSRPKIVKVVRFAGSVKIDDWNEAYQSFLRMNELFLLKKMHYTEEDLHKIRQSVPQIFRFLYNNLDKPVEFIREHLDQMLKDRNFTDIYVERFVELQGKKYGNLFHGKSKTIVMEGDRSVLRKATKKFTQRLSKMSFGRSSIASSKGSQRLIIRQMIKSIEDGYEVESQKIIDLLDESVEQFARNCEHLKKMVHKYDSETLNEIKEGILIKARKSFRENNSSQAQAKKAEIQKTVEVLDNRLRDLEKEDHNESFAMRSPKNRISRASYRTNSRNSACSRRSAFKDKLGNVQPQKSGFKPEPFIAQPNLEGSELIGSKDSHDAKGNEEELEMAISKKANTSKYRRMSHDIFLNKRKTSSNDYEDQSFRDTIRQLGINSAQPINDHLDTLADYVAQKFMTMQDLELKMSNAHLKKLVAKEQDSLLTVKRKARAFKKLLKEELPNQVKSEIAQYVSLLDKKNVAKNRNWAYQVIKNMVVTSDQVEIIAGEEEDLSNSLQNFIQKLIQQNIPVQSRLLYYHIFPTKYQQKEMNFEKNLFDFMRRKDEEDDDRRRRTQFTRQKTRNKKNTQNQEPEEINQGCLIQIGLNNRCPSSCFGLNMPDEQQYNQLFSQLNDAPKRSETAYFQMYEKLLNLQ